MAQADVAASCNRRRRCLHRRPVVPRLFQLAAASSAALLAFAALPTVEGQPANGCVFDPTQPECIDYVLKASQSLVMIEDVCDQAPELPACTIRRICASDPALGLLPYCSPFKLLSDACFVDAASSRGCRTWSQLCRPSSLVRQCAVEGPAAGLPSQREILRLLGETCSVYWGPPCDTCVAVGSGAYGEDDENTSSNPTISYPTQPPPYCEPLLAYSTHCRNLTDLPSCEPWSAFCAAAPTALLPLCEPPPPPPTPAPSPPPEPEPEMPEFRPYLHFGELEYVVFDWAIPRTEWEFSLALAAAFAVGLFYQFAVSISHYLERKWEAAGKLRVAALLQVEEDLRRREEEEDAAADAAVVVGQSSDTTSSETGRRWSLFFRRRPTQAQSEASEAPADGNEEPSDDVTAPLLPPPVLPRRRGRTAARIARYTYNAAVTTAREAYVRTTRTLLAGLSSVSLVAMVLLVATFNVQICGAVLCGILAGTFMFGGL